MASARTNFSVQEHGFRFVNTFDFSLKYDLPFLPPVDLGNIVYGLCGGMCLGALDYFVAGRTIPDQTTVPDDGTPLHRYLWERQVDSLSLPSVPLKVIEWMLHNDDEVGRLIARHEAPKLRRSIDKRKPAVLALIRVKGIDDPTKNHQVLATGYDFDLATRQMRIDLYDPNHPGQEPTLTVSLTRPSRGLDITQSSGELLRGFFVINYKPQTPP